MPRIERGVCFGVFALAVGLLSQSVSAQSTCPPGSPQVISQGVALQATSGPTPISPPIVSHHDYAHLPDGLRPLVTVEHAKH